MNIFFILSNSPENTFTEDDFNMFVNSFVFTNMLKCMLSTMYNVCLVCPFQSLLTAMFLQAFLLGS